MKAFVIYDSKYGNAEDVAISIGNALKPLMHVGIVRVADLEPELVEGLDFLIIGAPTLSFHASRLTKRFLVGIPKAEFKKMRILVYDTRTSPENTNSSFFLRIIDRFGYAAEGMKDILEKRGAKLIAAPEGFYVEDAEGALLEGEEERAVNWALQAVKKEID